MALSSGLLREPLHTPNSLPAPRRVDYGFPSPPAFLFLFLLLSLFFFHFGPGSLFLPLLSLLGKSWHQFWLQISWVARLHHVKIAISLYLCRAIFKGSKVWRSRLAAWQDAAHGYQHTGIWTVHSDSSQHWEQKERRGRKSANVFLHIVGIWPQDQQKYI